MPVQSTDIKFYYSGGTTNTSGNASLGGTISSTEIPDATLNALFDNVSSTEGKAGDVEYRCFFVKNTNTATTAETPHIWLSAQTLSSDHAIAIGLGTGGLSTPEQTVANESTAPSGVSFSTPTSEGAAISISNMAAGAYVAVWVRRTVTANPTPTAFANSCTVAFACDTGP